MTERTQTFHLGDLLSLTTPYLLAPTLLGGVERLVEHLTGEPRESDMHMLWVSRRARELLLTQHGWLTHVAYDGPDDDRNELITWFAQQVVERGAYHDVVGAAAPIATEVSV